MKLSSGAARLTTTSSLTTARYLTPQGHPITGHGIAPDVVATASTAGVGAGTDAELELASEVVKAASILERNQHPPGGVRWES